MTDGEPNTQVRWSNGLPNSAPYGTVIGNSRYWGGYWYSLDDKIHWEDDTKSSGSNYRDFHGGGGTDQTYANSMESMFQKRWNEYGINYSQSVKDYYRRLDIYDADRKAFDKVVSNGLNKWDYISNGTGALSAHPTIKSTWRYNSSGGNIRWTGKNGNYYIKSELKMNGGYAKSIKFAQNASKNLSRVGNALTTVSLITSGVSAGIALHNGTDNTSTWVGLGIGIGGAALTVIGSPVIVTGAAIVGAAWGVSQLLYGDEINGSIDSNFGYR